MRKHALFLACMVCLVVLLEIPTHAAGLHRAKTCAPTLTIRGTEATCSASYSGRRSDSISITLALKQGSTTIISWSDSGTQYVNIDKTYSVAAGKTYTLVMTVTVNGVRQPSISVTAKS